MGKYSQQGVLSFLNSYIVPTKNHIIKKKLLNNKKLTLNFTLHFKVLSFGYPRPLLFEIIPLLMHTSDS